MRFANDPLGQLPNPLPQTWRDITLIAKQFSTKNSYIPPEFAFASMQWWLDSKGRTELPKKTMPEFWEHTPPMTELYEQIPTKQRWGDRLLNHAIALAEDIYMHRYKAQEWKCRLPRSEDVKQKLLKDLDLKHWPASLADLPAIYAGLCNNAAKLLVEEGRIKKEDLEYVPVGWKGKAKAAILLREPSAFADENSELAEKRSLARFRKEFTSPTSVAARERVTSMYQSVGLSGPGMT